MEDGGDDGDAERGADALDDAEGGAAVGGLVVAETREGQVQDREGGGGEADALGELACQQDGGATVRTGEGEGKGASYTLPTPVRLRPGVDAADLCFESLGYLDSARESYAEFAKLKARGAIHRDCRFLVALPTPLAPIVPFVLRTQIDQVLPAYERALKAELVVI